MLKTATLNQSTAAGKPRGDDVSVKALARRFVVLK
jgi:hypothetical protein